MNDITNHEKSSNINTQHQKPSNIIKHHQAWSSRSRFDTFQAMSHLFLGRGVEVCWSERNDLPGHWRRDAVANAFRSLAENCRFRADVPSSGAKHQANSPWGYNCSNKLGKIPSICGDGAKSLICMSWMVECHGTVICMACFGCGTKENDWDGMATRFVSSSALTSTDSFRRSEWSDGEQQNQCSQKVYVVLSGNIWDNPSDWLIVFKMVKTTNQLLSFFLRLPAEFFPAEFENTSCLDQTHLAPQVTGEG